MIYYILLKNGEKTMTRVILESPYKGKDKKEEKRNIKYARKCVLDCLKKGESPIASHLLLTQPGILNDNIPENRRLGIDAGLAWKCVAEKQVFYIDFGMSSGMKYGLEYAKENNIPVEYRKLYN